MFGWFRSSEADRLEGVLKRVEKVFNDSVEGVGNEIVKANETISTLKKEKTSLEEKVEGLKLKTKIAEEDIKHMIKMKEEAQELDYKKKVMDVESEKERAIAEVKDRYRDKMEQRLITEGQNIKDMYSEILKRLPNVSVALDNTFGGKGDG